MKIGQIVEIPKNSSIYHREKPSFKSKEEEFIWEINQRKYSLFDGFIVGEHYGTENFEIGQRKGLNVIGKELPVYVIGIDVTENRLFVGQGKNHPGLFSNVLFFTEQNIAESKITILENEINVKVSSPILTQPIDAKFYKFEKNYFLEFEEQIPLIIENYTIGLSYKNKDVIILNK